MKNKKMEQQIQNYIPNHTLFYHNSQRNSIDSLTSWYKKEGEKTFNIQVERFGLTSMTLVVLPAFVPIIDLVSSQPISLFYTISTIINALSLLLFFFFPFFLNTNSLIFFYKFLPKFTANRAN